LILQEYSQSFLNVGFSTSIAPRNDAIPLFASLPVATAQKHAQLCTAAPHTIWPRAAAITSLELETSHNHALVVRCIALLQSRAVLSLLAYCQYEQSDFAGAAEK